MERKEVVTLLVMGFLGLISVAFGLRAEATRIKESQVTVADSKCVYPTSNPASGLAIAACLALALAEIIIIAITALSNFKRNPNQPVTNWTFATTFLVLHWIIYSIAITTFIISASIDARRGEQPIHNCGVNSPGVYIHASAYSFLSVILGIIYSCDIFKNDVSLSRVAPVNQVQIAMGQPIPQRLHKIY